MFHKILFKQLKFSGLRVIAWCFMGNHFHLLLEVPDKETALASLGEEEILARLSVFSDELSTSQLLREVEDWRRAGNVVGLSRIAERQKVIWSEAKGRRAEDERRRLGWTTGVVRLES